MQKRRFERLVEDTLDDLPTKFRERLENVAVVVEDYPDPQIVAKLGPGTILGLFSGVPNTFRSTFHSPQQPNIIYIYQRNIEAICPDEDMIKQQIRETMLHEVGHHFGLSEADLQRIERKRRDENNDCHNNRFRRYSTI